MTSETLKQIDLIAKKLNITSLYIIDFLNSFKNNLIEEEIFEAVELDTYLRGENGDITSKTTKDMFLNTQYLFPSRYDYFDIVKEFIKNHNLNEEDLKLFNDLYPLFVREDYLNFIDFNFDFSKFGTQFLFKTKEFHTETEPRLMISQGFIEGGDFEIKAYDIQKDTFCSIMFENCHEYDFETLIEEKRKWKIENCKRTLERLETI